MIRRRDAFSCESFFEIDLQQFGWRKHHPAVSVTRRILDLLGLNSTLLLLVEIFLIKLLTETTDQCRRLSGSWRPDNEQLAVQWQAKYLVLITIQDRLVSQSHLGDDTPAYSIDEIRGPFLVSQNLRKKFVTEIDFVNRGERIPHGDEGKRAVSQSAQNGIARVPVAIVLKRMQKSLLKDLAFDPATRSRDIKLVANRKRRPLGELRPASLFPGASSPCGVVRQM
jgi:hypothetical protein